VRASNLARQKQWYRRTHCYCFEMFSLELIYMLFM